MALASGPCKTTMKKMHKTLKNILIECNKVAVRHELNLLLNSDKLIGMNGPHKAGNFSDHKMF